MEEWFLWCSCVAHRALADGASLSLLVDRLKIIGNGFRRADGVLWTMASSTEDAAVTFGVLEEFALFLVVEARVNVAVAVPAFGFADPWNALRIGHGIHISVTVDALDLEIIMDVTLAFGLSTGMAGVATVVEMRKRLHSGSVRAVHRVRKR